MKIEDVVLNTAVCAVKDNSQGVIVGYDAADFFGLDKPKVIVKMNDGKTEHFYLDELELAKHKQSNKSIYQRVANDIFFVDLEHVPLSFVKDIEHIVNVAKKMFNKQPIIDLLNKLNDDGIVCHGDIEFHSGFLYSMQFIVVIVKDGSPYYTALTQKGLYLKKVIDYMNEICYDDTFFDFSGGDL